MDGGIAAEEVLQVSDEKTRVPTARRTSVIVLSQVVVIVALVVLWSVLRGRQSSD